jgi:MFS family permease
MRPFAGAGVDLWGRRHIFFAAMIVFGLMFNGYLLVSTLAALAVVRFAQGMAWGTAGISGSTAVVDIIPAGKRSQGLAYHGMASSLASVFAAALGLAVAAAAGYDVLFVSCIAVCFVDYPIHGRSAKPFHWSTLIEPTAVPVAVTFLLVALTTGGLTGFLAIYARERGYGGIGSFFTIAAVSGIVARWIAGGVFARRGPREVCSAAIAMVALSFPVLTMAGSWWGFPLAAVLYGAGSGTLYLSFQTMANNMVPPRRRGAANATLFTILNLGYAIGRLVTGVMADSVGLDNTFLSFTVANVLALGLFFAFVLGHYRRTLATAVPASVEPA